MHVENVLLKECIAKSFLTGIDWNMFYYKDVLEGFYHRNAIGR